MKTLSELYAEASADEGLRNDYVSAKNSGSISEFLREHGCEATEEEIAEFTKGMLEKRGELDDDELDDVAAGKKCGTLYTSDGWPVVMSFNSCQYFKCLRCQGNGTGVHKWGSKCERKCKYCEYIIADHCVNPKRRYN